MPERPPPPDDIIGKFNDALRRLRAVENLLPELGDAFDPLQTYKNGNLLGDTRHLDFGPGITAQTIGEEFVRISASAGAGELDAIVDFDGGVTNTGSAPPIFQGIGEASQYLFDAGFTSAVIGVRGSNTVYTETVDWDSPGLVRIKALRFSGALTRLENVQCEWDWNGFSPTAKISMQLEGFASWEPLNAGQATENFFEYLSLIDADLSITAPSGVVAFLCDYLQTERANIDLTGSSTTIRLATNDAMMYDTDLLTNVSSGNSWTFIPAGSSLTMDGCRWTRTDSSGDLNVTLPAVFDLDVSASARRLTSSASGRQIILNVPSSGAGRIKCGTEGDGGEFGVHAVSAFDSLEIEGMGVQPRTISGAHDNLQIKCGVAVSSPACDITGPATIDICATGGANLKFRGQGIAGHIAADALTTATVFLDFIAATNCAISIGSDVPSAVGKKPFAFDGSCANNYLVFPEHGSWPSAGTGNTGTNIVVPPIPSSALSGLEVRDEGADQGDAVTFDFVGPGVTAAVAAGVATITVAGGGSDGLTVADWAGF